MLHFVAGPFFIVNNIGGSTIHTHKNSKRVNYTEECTMLGSQVERLKRDCREMEFFIKRQEKRGNDKKAYTLQKKYDYMKSRIEELEETLATAA